MYKNTDFNKNPALKMHIDINSCFATILQQAYHNLRNKPLVISAYDSLSSCILAASIEAKELGIKTGMKVFEAKTICPNLIIKLTDIDLINDVHCKFIKILKNNCENVTPKSIDEAILDFSNYSNFKEKDVLQKSYKIKEDIQKSIGDWMMCSIGIGTNRFLAKTAASFKKPNGLTLINYLNVLNIYKQLKLTDLYGINKKLSYRLEINNIKNVIDFLNADFIFLKKKVFKSINGFYWYKRLRGWEIDDIISQRKSFSQQYALIQPTNNNLIINKIVFKLTEKMTSRLRNNNFTTQGVGITFLYDNYEYFQKSSILKKNIYSTFEIFEELKKIYNLKSYRKIRKVNVCCFNLKDKANLQLNLFNDELKKISLFNAIDKINNKFGENKIYPFSIQEYNQKIAEKIGFGKINDIKIDY